MHIKQTTTAPSRASHLQLAQALAGKPRGRSQHLHAALADGTLSSLKGCGVAGDGVLLLEGREQRLHDPRPVMVCKIHMR